MKMLPIAGFMVAFLALGACAQNLDEQPEPEDVTAVRNLVSSGRSRGFEIAQAGPAARAQAEQQYMRALEVEPNNVEALLSLGEIRLTQGRYEDALQRFRVALDQQPGDPRALQGYGIASTLKGDFEQGPKALSEALATDPTLWRSWNVLGQNWDREQEWSRAEACYREALRHSPGEASVLNNLGMSYFLQERYNQAVSTFREALSYDPDFEIARTNVDIALALTGNYQPSGSTTQPQELARRLNNFGYIAMQRGDYERAERLLQEAIRVSPVYYGKAHENLKLLSRLRSGV